MDISMCNNKECPSFDKCKRAQATPDPHWQAWNVFAPKAGEDKCDSFIEWKKD